MTAFIVRTLILRLKCMKPSLCFIRWSWFIIIFGLPLFSKFYFILALFRILVFRRVLDGMVLMGFRSNLSTVCIVGICRLNVLFYSYSNFKCRFAKFASFSTGRRRNLVGHNHFIKYFNVNIAAYTTCSIITF